MRKQKSDQPIEEVLPAIGFRAQHVGSRPCGPLREEPLDGTGLWAVIEPRVTSTLAVPPAVVFSAPVTLH